MVEELENPTKMHTCKGKTVTKTGDEHGNPIVYFDDGSALIIHFGVDYVRKSAGWYFTVEERN